MRYHVVGKQPNSKMCFVCGLKNPSGLRAYFYELDNGELMAVFTAIEEHQSYPGLLHGGVATAILDETIGRAILTKQDEPVWGVSVEFRIRYKKPMPLCKELKAIGRITKNSGSLFEGTGEILLPDGSVAAEGHGKYLKRPLEKIAEFDFDEEEWRVVSTPDDPAEVEL